MKQRWTRSLSEHGRRDDRVLGAARGEHALLQVDAIDPVVPEDVVAVGLQETPNAVEIPVPVHPSQGHMGLARSSLRGESEGLERGVQRRGGPADRLGPVDADPDDVHSRETRERPGLPHRDLERPNVGTGLANRAFDFGDQALLGVAQELHREVELVRGHDLEGSTCVVQLLGKLLQGARRCNDDGAESAARSRIPPRPATASDIVARTSYSVRRFMQTPCHHSTKVPRNGLPKIADRSAFRSRPATTLSGVRSRATTRAAMGSNTMLGPAAACPFPARSMSSWNVIRPSNRAVGSFRGSVVYTPATEVAFTIRAAWTNRAREALTRSVV